MLMWSRFLFSKKYPELNPIRIIFAIYALGFLYGTRNHLIDIYRDGFLGYTYVPWLINLYWTLLTFFDPLTVILLLFFPLGGILLAILIMASDLIINLSVAFYFYQRTGIFSNGLLSMQISFGLFVFLTSSYAQKRVTNFLQRMKNC